MDTIVIYFLFLIIIILILYYKNDIITKYKKKNIEENFCPDALTRDSGRYILWKNMGIVDVFDTYDSYLEYFELNCYKNKCKPLIPSNNNNLKISQNAMEKNWINDGIRPRYKNIEEFINNSRSMRSKKFFKNLRDTEKDMHIDYQKKYGKYIDDNSDLNACKKCIRRGYSNCTNVCPNKFINIIKKTYPNINDEEARIYFNYLIKNKDSNKQNYSRSKKSKEFYDKLRNTDKQLHVDYQNKYGKYSNSTKEKKKDHKENYLFNIITNYKKILSNNDDIEADHLFNCNKCIFEYKLGNKCDKICNFNNLILEKLDIINVLGNLLFSNEMVGENDIINKENFIDYNQLKSEIVSEEQEQEQEHLEIINNYKENSCFKKYPKNVVYDLQEKFLNFKSYLKNKLYNDNILINLFFQNRIDIGDINNKLNDIFFSIIEKKMEFNTRNSSDKQNFESFFHSCDKDNLISFFIESKENLKKVNNLFEMKPLNEEIYIIVNDLVHELVEHDNISQSIKSKDMNMLYDSAKNFFLDIIKNDENSIETEGYINFKKKNMILLTEYEIKMLDKFFIKYFENCNYIFKNYDKNNLENLIDKIVININSKIFEKINTNTDKLKGNELIFSIINILSELPNCHEFLRKIVNNKEKKNKKINYKDCSCRGKNYIYDNRDNTCLNNETGDIKDVCLPSYKKYYIKKEIQFNPIRNLILRIEKEKNKWLNTQTKCLELINNDISYKKKFTTSYQNYNKYGYIVLLGYIPNTEEVEKGNVSYSELMATYILLLNMPNCELLIMLFYQPLSKNIVKKDTTLNINWNKKVQNYIQMEKNLRDKRINKDINNNSNNLGYLENIYNKMLNIESRVENIEDDHDRKKISNIFDENNNNILENKDYYQSSNSREYELLTHNKKENIEVVEENKKNVIYKPKYEFNHNQPSKKIASAYGWSYIPPQFWSVPQKRPPVCIPNKGDENYIYPSIEKGVPVNALDWTKVGSILPKFEYTEIYNPDYYYPGWISQKNINYPNNGSNFSNKYYNYNKAELYHPAERINK